MLPTAFRGFKMPERLMSELWDYIAQQFRDTISRAEPEELTYRLSPSEYSVAEIAWRGLGSVYQWSAILSGASTLEGAVGLDPSGMDLIQAARNAYAPGRFPDSMPAELHPLLERADQIMAMLGAQVMELSPAARAQHYETWWDATYTGDEILARMLWSLSYSDGQMHLVISHSERAAEQPTGRGT